MSDKELSGNTADSMLKRTFEQWDAGEPSTDLWRGLDESLSLESVWSKVNASLDDASTADEMLKEAHDEWQPAMEHDVWERLNESLSLEQVWTGLNASLAEPVATRTPYWKIACALLVALCSVMQFSDTPSNPGRQLQSTLFTTSVAPNDELAISDESVDSTETPHVQYATTSGSELQQQHQTHTPLATQDLSTQQASHGAERNVRLLNQQPEQETQGDSAEIILSNAEPEVNPEEFVTEVPETDFALPLRTWSVSEGLVAPLHLMPSMRQPYYHWTLQVGAQLSFLQERNQNSLTSTLPRPSMAADLTYRHRIKNVQLIHAIGISQYAQVAGKYINGRYCNSDQQINALQFSSSLAYTAGRFTFYGGVLFSRMLTGLEENDNKVTKMYDFNRVQPGFTTGVDFRLVAFPNSGKHISIGTQYQFLPLRGANTSFESIHGLRLQAKFSF